MKCLIEVLHYFADVATLGRYARGETFAPELDSIAQIIAGVYGVHGQEAVDGEGSVELRQCTIVEGRTPRRFRVIILGLPAGAEAFCILPCCGSLVEVQVTRRARGIIFPQSQQCLERCGPQ